MPTLPSAVLKKIVTHDEKIRIKNLHSPLRLETVLRSGVVVRPKVEPCSAHLIRLCVDSFDVKRTLWHVLDERTMMREKR